MARKLFVVVAVLITFVASGLPRASAATRYVDRIFTDFVKTENIQYGESVNAEGETEALLLDHYEGLGDEETNRPLYIWAHGGNFRGGDKAEVGAIRDYVRRGWVAVSINYRVDENVPPGGDLRRTREPADARRHPSGSEGCSARHASRGSLGARERRRPRDRPEQDRCGWSSAGAIMSLMTAFNPNDPQTSGTPGYSSAVQAAVSHAGVVLAGPAGRTAAARRAADLDHPRDKRRASAVPDRSHRVRAHPAYAQRLRIRYLFRRGTRDARDAART